MKFFTNSQLRRATLYAAFLIGYIVALFTHRAKAFLAGAKVTAIVNDADVESATGKYR